jgi:outer membrane protein TolC
MEEVMIKRILAAILVFSVMDLQTYAAGLTLLEAVDKGLKEDNTLKELSAGVMIAEAGLLQAKMSRFGLLKINSMYTDGNDPVYAFSTSMKQGTFSMASMSTINNPETLHNYMAGVEAGIPIFTGSAISNGIKTAKLSEEAARNSYQRAKVGSIFKISSQWLTVLLMTKLVEIAEVSVSSTETELKMAKMLKDKGMVLGSDYYGAEAILSLMKGYRLNWQKSLDLEKQKLAIMLGLSSSELPEIVGTLSEISYPEKDIAAVSASIGTDRLDIKAMKNMVEIYKIKQDTQKNSILPVIETFGSWEINSKSLSDFNSSRIVGLRMTISLGDPAYFAKKEAAEAERYMSEIRLQEAQKQAIIEATEAWNNYTTTIENIKIAKETLKKARQSLEIFLPLYRQGRQSVLEVLRAKASVLQAEASYYENIYKLHLFYAKLLLTEEKLNEQAVEEMSLKLSYVSDGR